MAARAFRLKWLCLRIAAWHCVARGGEARLWLAEQSSFDVLQAAQRFKVAPMRVQPAPATVRKNQRPARC